MIIRIMLLGALATFIANAADASVYFDSVNVSGANAGADGLREGVSEIAQSFTAPTPDFKSISLYLSAVTPSDGGSVAVYLVPDNGTGSTTGVAGSPTYTPGGSSFSQFSNAQVIGTIADSSLTTTPSLVTLSVASSAAAAVAAATKNNEYWVGLVLGAGESVEWEFNSGSPDGVGTTGQALFNNLGGVGTLPVGPGAGPYGMIVTTPEPMTIAILGVGLAGLGYVRTRSSRRS